MDGIAQFANNNIIEGNLITRSGHNTTRYGSICCGGITASGGNGTIIRNNIVYGNEVNGIEVGQHVLTARPITTRPTITLDGIFTSSMVGQGLKSETTLLIQKVSILVQELVLEQSEHESKFRQCGRQ